MNIGMIVSGAPLLASGAAAATLAVLAIFGSNRIQRQINGSLARMLGRVRSSQARGMSQVLARLDRIRTLDEFFDEIPWITARAARVTPVTLFRLEGDQYVPVTSTALGVTPQPVWADEPLARTLQRTDSVRYLIGRPDDLDNAPIHAINGAQVEACNAICAIPLKREGRLVGFLLCGPAVDAPCPDLTLMSAFETLADRVAAVLKGLPAGQHSESSEVIAEDPTLGEELPERLARRTPPSPARLIRDHEAEPQMVGTTGGFQTRD
jgi:transcriptional regulator with GAF, ATPase, and Fis domain